MDYLLKETARLLVMRDKLMSLITLRVYESSFTELLTMSVRVRDVHIGRSSCRIKLLLFLLSVCNVVEARPAGETRLLKAARVVRLETAFRAVKMHYETQRRR